MCCEFSSVISYVIIYIYIYIHIILYLSMYCIQICVFLIRILIICKQLLYKHIKLTAHSPCLNMSQQNRLNLLLHLHRAAGKAVVQHQNGGHRWHLAPQKTTPAAKEKYKEKGQMVDICLYGIFKDLWLIEHTCRLQFLKYLAFANAFVVSPVPKSSEPRQAR